MLDEILQDTKSAMEKSLLSLDASFKRIRTGRANPSLLDDIKIDYYGNPTPVQQVANISVEDAKCLSIVPWKRILFKISKKPFLHQV